MNYIALALIVGIGLYTVLEYRRRERHHQEALRNVRGRREQAVSGQKHDIPKPAMTESPAVVQEPPVAGGQPRLWRFFKKAGSGPGEKSS